MRLAGTLNHLGAWIINALWPMSVELAVLAGVVACAILLLRIKRPATRHLFCCLVLAKPLATLLLV